MAPATGNAALAQPKKTALPFLFQFVAGMLLVSLVLSLLAVPWVDLSWWKILRRCVSIGAATSAWWCIKFQGRHWRAYGLPSLGMGKRDLIFGCLLGICTLGVMFFLGLQSGVCRVNITPDKLKLWRTVLGFLPAAALVGVLEEVTFRGIILQSLLAVSRPFAIATSSLIYALVHLKTLPVTTGTVLEIVGLFLLGGVLAMSYLWTRRLYLAIGLHAVLAYGARVNKLVIDIPPTPLNWLTGTSRLVNGLAGWLALLAMGAIVLWWTRRSRGDADHGMA